MEQSVCGESGTEFPLYITACHRMSGIKAGDMGLILGNNANDDIHVLMP